MPQRNAPFARTPDTDQSCRFAEGTRRIVPQTLYEPSTSKGCMADRSRTVLHVSPDATLTESRTKVLGEIGCEVCSVPTLVAALFQISLGRCGILLLCHKLEHTARCTVAEYFDYNCPEPDIVAVLAHKDDRYPPQAHAWSSILKTMARW